jgi:hypothetical protein
MAEAQPALRHQPPVVAHCAGVGYRRILISELPPGHGEFRLLQSAAQHWGGRRMGLVHRRAFMAASAATVVVPNLAHAQTPTANNMAWETNDARRTRCGLQQFSGRQ